MLGRRFPAVYSRRSGGEGVALDAPRGEKGLGLLVGDEEEGGARGGANDGGADTGVDTGEAAGGAEAGGGLQAGL